MRRLKSLFAQRHEGYSSKENLQVLSLLKDVGVIPYDEKGNIGNKSKDDVSGYNVARKGDIVMNSMNVIIGSVDITDYDGYISPICSYGMEMPILTLSNVLGPTVKCTSPHSQMI